MDDQPEKNEHAAMIGRLGGLKRSPAKTAALRFNGLSRGRRRLPKKTTHGQVVGWPDPWGNKRTHRTVCDWGGCENRAAFARFDKDAGWLPCCIECAKKPIEGSESHEGSGEAGKDQQ